MNIQFVFSDSNTADHINLRKEIFHIVYFTERHLFTFCIKNIYHFSIFQDNFATLILFIYFVISKLLLDKVIKSLFDRLLPNGHLPAQI